MTTEGLLQFTQKWCIQIIPIIQYLQLILLSLAVNGQAYVTEDGRFEYHYFCGHYYQHCIKVLEIVFWCVCVCECVYVWVYMCDLIVFLNILKEWDIIVLFLTDEKLKFEKVKLLDLRPSHFKNRMEPFNYLCTCNKKKVNLLGIEG
jgi:hypothetical protein